MSNKCSTQEVHKPKGLSAVSGRVSLSQRPWPFMGPTPEALRPKAFGLLPEDPNVSPGSNGGWKFD